MIIRIEKNSDNPYVMIDKGIFNDPELSLRAKGLMGYLLSKPDNWEIIQSDIVKHTKESVKAVRSTIQELIEHRYIRPIWRRDTKGRVKELTYIIYERPYDPLPGENISSAALRKDNIRKD